MLIDSNLSKKLTWPKLLSGLLLLAALTLLPLTSFAEDATLRASKVHGELAKGYSKHFLALEPAQRDALITLTLNIEPQDKRRIPNKVNLLLLDEDDLRRVLAGDKPEDLAFATGNPAIVDPHAPPKLIFNKTAEFKASGRGTYTVVVYNRAPIPVSYTLTAKNAAIVDGSGQVTAAE
jgi:hypothetical protein